MSYYTLINCMDGRVQLPVINYLMERHEADYIDSITEPGPNRILSEQEETALIDSMLERVKISVEKHGSGGIAVAAHHDCTGNPSEKDVQLKQLKEAASFISKSFPGVPVKTIWVDENWIPSEIRF